MSENGDEITRILYDDMKDLKKRTRKLEEDNAVNKWVSRVISVPVLGYVVKFVIEHVGIR